MRRLVTALALVAGCAGAPLRATAPALDPEALLLADAGLAPAQLHCNRENRWGSTLRSDAEAGARELFDRLQPQLRDLAPDLRAATVETIRKALFWRMVRAVLIEGDNHNFGVIALRDHTFTGADGRPHPVLLFRSGFTPAPDAAGSCFGSLLEAGVRHVVNLFDGDIPVQDLVDRERAAAAARGATYHVASDEAEGGGGYGPWRDLLRKSYDDPAARKVATLAVARLVRDEILRPGGQPPRGHLHVHCGGGMHRTGIIVGLVERCVNREPWAVVEAHYQRHVGFRDEAHPGGLEPGNLRFLREFDCGLLAAQ